MAEESKKYRTGIVLSGGGARGIAHLGAIKALQEYGFHFDIIAGTSMGAIIGCLIADGYTPDEVIKKLSPNHLKNFIKTSLSLNGVMTMKGGMDFLQQLLHTERIEDLPTPFIATATNLNDGRVKYFSSGNIIEAVSASASIPIVFPPVVIEGVQYIDGGVLNNMPAHHIHKDCELLIGSNVNPRTLGLHHGEVKGFAQIAERTFHLAMLSNVLPGKRYCNIYIEHAGLEEYSMLFDFPKMKEIVDIGYRNTMEVLACHEKSGSGVIRPKPLV